MENRSKNKINEKVVSVFLPKDNQIDIWDQPKSKQRYKTPSWLYKAKDSYFSLLITISLEQFKRGRCWLHVFSVSILCISKSSFSHVVTPWYLY